MAASRAVGWRWSTTASWRPTGPCGSSVTPTRARSSPWKQRAQDRIEADSSIGPAILGGKHVWIRFDTRSRVYPPGAERPGFTYNETTTYQGHRDQVEDAATSNARCQVSYNSVLGFKPWMAMGDIRGALSNNATGEKVRSVAELPADIREFLAATHPDILKDPRAAVDASPGAA
jgi:hypothetical protein